MFSTERERWVFRKDPPGLQEAFSWPGDIDYGTVWLHTSPHRLF